MRFLLAALSAALLATPPSAPAQAVGTLATVSGKVLDLSRDSQGSLLYCTDQGDVGRITTNGSVTLLANAASGPFPNPLRAVAAMPNGDVAVVDSAGIIYRLPQGAPPAIKVYDDLFMIAEATDLVVDAAGNFVVASLTPSTGVRALNWVSSNGANFSYYLVQHAPIAIASDPLTGNLVLADEANNGALRMVSVSDETHSTTPLDTTTLPGFQGQNGDGDLAFEANGDILYVAGGSLYRFSRATGHSTSLVSGLQQLRGAAIAASSGGVASPTGSSVYLAEGANPTKIREVGGVGAAASPLSPSLGSVPGRGNLVFTGFGMNVYEMTADRNGDLLLGGDNWGVGQAVKRLAIPTLKLTTVAAAADGISGRVEGISQSPDGSLFALTSSGIIHRIHEGPLSVTTHFADATNKIATGKDLGLARDGALYIANRGGWGWGDLYRVDPSGSVAFPVIPTQETRGLCADPFTGRFLYAEWNSVGFSGTVASYDPVSGAAQYVPGFVGMNFTNDLMWGDGDLIEDVQGNIYTCSEDDFSVWRYNRYSGKLVRIASGYLNHLSGLAIAKSSPLTPSTTGWSLYIAEFDRLWEIGGVAPAGAAILDPGAGTPGRCAGFLVSSVGTPRAMAADPSGSGLLVSTSAGQILRLDPNNGSLVSVAGAPQGLSGDLMAMAPAPAGHLLVANRAGVVYNVNPQAGYAASIVWNNSGGALLDVRGLCADSLGRPVVVDRVGAAVSKVRRVNGGQLDLLAFSARGLRPAVDPLTGEIFVSEQGAPGEAGGEILRIEALAAPPRSGHYQRNTYTTYPAGDFDGAIAFDDSGNLYIAEGDAGRVVATHRSSGADTIVGANYARPTALVLAPGTPGTAGALGTSLYVLDGYAIYEVGVDGLPVPAPPNGPPSAAPAALRIQGFAATGATVPVLLESPADANRMYLVVASISGKSPGFPLSSVFDPNDPRRIPNNPDDVWALVNTPVMPGFFGVLDAAGKGPPAMAVVLPNDPSIIGLQRFLDFAWITFDPAYQSGVSTIGGTAQLFLGL